jgi:hypothetical protein
MLGTALLAGVCALALALALILAACENGADTPPPPTVTSVTVTPATASVAKGGTQQFSAAVSGENEPSQTVTWTVTGGGSGTSISTAGPLGFDPLTIPGEEARFLDVCQAQDFLG